MPGLSSTMLLGLKGVDSYESHFGDIQVSLGSARQPEIQLAGHTHATHEEQAFWIISLFSLLFHILACDS